MTRIIELKIGESLTMGDGTIVRAVSTSASASSALPPPPMQDEYYGGASQGVIAALKEASHLLHGQAKLADAIEVKPPTLNQWLKGKRPVPPGKCAAIERVTGGKVTVEAISPGGWSRIPDATWPHPMGRPVREVA